MNSLKTLSFTTAALIAAAAPADAFFRAALRVDKEYRQDGTGVPIFRNGSAFLYVIDGVFTFTSSCTLNGQGAIFGIDTMAGCNIGANGVVVDTSVEAPMPPGANPPVYFVDQEFFEIIGIEEATVVEPGLNDRVSLYARPATSDFPKVTPAIDGYPTSIFYDLQSITGNVRQYKLAGDGSLARPGYFFVRPYSSRKVIEQEMTEGVFQYAFPQRLQSTKTVYLNFPVVNTVEGFVEKPIRGGFRFINLPSFGDGFSQYDYRVPITIQWEGLSTSLVRPADRLYVSFRSISDQNDATSAAGGILFPPGVPVRILLDNPLQTSYTLPPGFFFNNQKIVFEVILQRDPGIGIAPVSERVFQLPVEFTDTFPGAMAVAFPEGTPASKLAKDADPDGDGISNWVEWLSGTNPNKANAPRTLSPMTFVPPSAAKAGEPSSGYYQMTFPRLDNPANASLPEIQSSTDLKTWTVLSDSDPEWKKDLSNPALIRVMSKTAQLTSKRYFRVALSASL